MALPSRKIQYLSAVILSFFLLGIVLYLLYIPKNIESNTPKTPTAQTTTEAAETLDALDKEIETALPVDSLDADIEALQQ